MRKLYKYIFVPVLMILLMYVFKTLEYTGNINLYSYGIFPKKIIGLRGIVTTPFIHGSFEHLYSNTMPFLLLSTAIFYFYKNVSLKVISLMWILSGFGVWLGGRPCWHLGASGLIYAFASFLFFGGILNKSRRLIAISLLVSFLYGGIIWGIFPRNEGISWESHLFGFLSGIVIAYFYGKQKTLQTNAVKISKEDFIHSTATRKIVFKYFYNEAEK